MPAHTLLLADESPTTRRVVELSFSGGDFRIVAMPDGDEAIAWIARERPDIVLADIALPKRSGYEVAAAVKRQAGLAHIPVVLLAGALEPLDDARIEASRCDAVLRKPFEPQFLAARVRALLARVHEEPEHTPMPVEHHYAGDVVSDEAVEVPTLDRLLGHIGHDAHRSELFSLDAVMPGEVPVANRSAHASVAEAFTSLLAVEQHESDTIPVGVYALTTSVRTELLVEEITRRVLERLQHGRGGQGHGEK